MNSHLQSCSRESSSDESGLLSVRSQSELAPIGLSTYSRLQHVQKTVAALQKNELAKESELYIFSDAPKAGDEEKVNAVRRYLRTIDGFKAVHIFERTENNRVLNNRGGMRMLLDKYGKMIFLEEDVVTSPSFLAYMNQALEAYQFDKKVFAISGYCPPIDTCVVPDDSDVYLLPCCYYWGIGVWKDRFEQVRMSVPMREIVRIFSNPISLNSFLDSGMDVPLMFLHDAQGKLDALDVKSSFEMWKRGSYMLHPKQSLCNNIGFDGTGENCWEIRLYDTNAMTERKDSFRLPSNIEPHNLLIDKHAQLRANGLSRIRWMARSYREFFRFLIVWIKP